MSEGDALKLVQDALFTVAIAAGPAVGLATIVGLVIAVFQALTQVQEASLTFVPKIITIVAAILLFTPLIASHLMTLTSELYGKIETGF